MTQHDIEMAEIRETLNRITLSQERRERDFEKTKKEADARSAKADADFERMRKEADERKKEADADFERMRKEADARSAKADADFERMRKERERDWKAMNKRLGEYGFVQGEMTEEMVYRGLQNIFGEIGKDFDEISQNVTKRGQAEFDIVAVNGTEVLVTEVKTKVRRDDIDKFVKNRLPYFKEYFPKYAEYNILGAVGGNVFRNDLAQYAQKQGLYVIRQTGENLKIENSKDFTAKVFA